MKISITMVILGTLIVFACVYIGSWMLFGIDSLFDVTVTGTSGELVQDATPRYGSLFDIARYAFFLNLALGLTIVITGAAWNRVNGKQPVAFTQAVCGVLIALTAAFIILCGCSFDYIIPIEGGPVLTVGYIISTTAITGLLGLVITTLAVIQFFRMKS